MNKRLLGILQYVFFIGLAVFFVWLSLRGLNEEKWQELKRALHRAHYWLLAPVLTLLGLSHWFRAMRWRQLIEPMGYKPSKANTFLGVMIGYFVNLGAPRFGEVVKCTILARYEKVPAEKLVGTIVAERAVDVICLVLVFALALSLQFDVINSLMVNILYPLFHNANGKMSWRKIFIVVGICLIIFFTVRYLLVRLAHINFVQRVSGILAGVWHGLTTIRYLKNKPLFFLNTVAIWSLYLFTTWVGFFALRETSHLTLTDALTVLAMGSIGMIVSPGGIGAYALFVQETVAFYDIIKEPYGQALGWLLWFGQFISFILFGVISFILLPRINRTPHAKPAGIEP
jgi:uncharacterized protein (TIRG00374 family)